MGGDSGMDDCFDLGKKNHPPLKKSKNKIQYITIIYAVCLSVNFSKNNGIYI
jgi:hypothetical protein